MEIEEALTTYLLAQSGLTVLIERRFFYDILPEKCELPAVCVINISDVKDHTLTGQLKLERPVFQFTAYAQTKAQAKNVAEQIKKALQDFQGSMSGIEIQYIKLLNELSTLYTSPDGLIQAYTTDLEFEINYVRSD